MTNSTTNTNGSINIKNALKEFVSNSKSFVESSDIVIKSLGYDSDLGGAEYTAIEFIDFLADNLSYIDKREAIRKRFCEKVESVYVIS